MKKRSDKQAYHVPEELNGQTVPAVLRRWQSDLSWNDAGRLLVSRRVSINGTICLDAGRRVKTADVVHLHAFPKAPQPTADDILILHLDRHVVVAVKPALMTTLRHREERNWDARRKNLQPTMDESLPLAIQAYEQKNQKKIVSKLPQVDPRAVTKARDRQSAKRQSPNREGPIKKLPRVYAVHRLDRDTSGVMVFARTPEADTNLVRQFKKHTIERVYQAIVHGQLDAMRIESYLIRDRGDGLRGSTQVKDEGDRAVTHVRSLESLGRYSLVECRLETGRTHQIRIHLSELGHMLCGENMYTKSSEGKRIADRSNAPRLALHAAQLAFDHPISSKRLSFSAPLPKDLKGFVDRLREPGNKPS